VIVLKLPVMLVRCILHQNQKEPSLFRFFWLYRKRHWQIVRLLSVFVLVFESCGGITKVDSMMEKFDTRDRKSSALARTRKFDPVLGDLS
jgi:hypothetical protein